MHIFPDKSFVQKAPAFKDFLRAHGCEIIEPKSEYEVVRFQSALGIGVLYAGKKGITANTPFVKDAIDAFQKGLTWHAGKVDPTARTPSAKRKFAILSRDGDLCFYCSHPMLGDVTEEHLVPASMRGSNHLDNIVLAHAACNKRAGHKSLIEKIKLRDRMRPREQIYSPEPGEPS